MIKETYQPLRLFEMRINAGMTQATLASMTGASLATIMNIEHNVQVPSLLLAHRISLALGKTIHEVFFVRD